MASLYTASKLSPVDTLAAETITSVVWEESLQDVAVDALKLAGAIGGKFDLANQDNGSSKLGTLEHWNSVYSSDLQTFQGDDSDGRDGNGVFDGDGGENWYGEDVTDKMVNFVSPFCVTGAKILDVGTGNGDLLCRFVEYCNEETKEHPYFIGTDYSVDAVTLAKAVLTRRGEQWVADDVKEDRTAKNHNEVEFLVDNILQSCVRDHSVDVFLDKGTFDAMSCLYDDYRGTVRMQTYVKTLARLGKPGKSVLCLTTANFTKKEIKDMFSASGWDFVNQVKYPVFSFGGGTGSHVNTLLYRLRDHHG
jgi:ubiquinone/menaquinone biosynthesis C-methylase UbiE